MVQVYKNEIINKNDLFPNFVVKDKASNSQAYQ